MTTECSKAAYWRDRALSAESEASRAREEAGELRRGLATIKEQYISCVNKVRAGLAAGGCGPAVQSEIYIGNVVCDGIIDALEDMLPDFNPGD